MAKNDRRYSLANTIGDRGEQLAVLALTDYEHFDAPLFDVTFLGEKWPVSDCLVELVGPRQIRPFFIAQIKSTRAALAPHARRLRITIDRRKLRLLNQIPGPTYLIGVHEPSRRVFIHSVHPGVKQSLSSIPLAFELKPANLRTLFEEVRTFWKSIKSADRKPKFSRFA